MWEGGEGKKWDNRRVRVKSCYTEICECIYNVL